MREQARKTIAEQVLMLLDHGNRWARGSLHATHNRAGKVVFGGAYCLIGAYAKVTIPFIDWMGSDDEPIIVSYLRNEHPVAFNALQRAMQGIIPHNGKLYASVIFSWQDRKETTFADIERVLCAAHLEELAARQLGNPTDHD